MNITIFIPAYNESATITDVVEEAFQVLEEINLDGEVLVVNDGSTDNTGFLLDVLKNTYPNLRIIHHPRNLGIAQAMIAGYSHAKGDLIFFNSADKQAPMSYLKTMLPLLDQYDMVVGAYYQRKDSPGRVFCSRVYHLLVRLLFGISLHNVNALKLFKQVCFDPRHPYTDSLVIDTEIVAVAQHRGFRVGEIALTHFSRMSGSSKVVSPKKTFRTFCALFMVYSKLVIYKKQPRPL